MISGIAATFLT